MSAMLRRQGLPWVGCPHRPRVPAHSLVRLYSIPTDITPNPPKRPHPPLPSNRPSPLKPLPTPANSIRRQLSPDHKEKPSVKEAAIQDIHKAEEHGILTPPPPDANWFKRTLHQAIQLAKFYFRGVKMIIHRRKDIAAIQARIRDGGSPLTRAEYRLMHTQRDDINKVIPFVIIALLLEEVIPFIAIYAPFLLPSTCILPSQRERIDTKRTEKALSLITANKHVFDALKSAQTDSTYLSLDTIRAQNASTAICGLLGLSSIGFDFLRIRRIQKHLQFITEDDRLLMQDSTPLSNSQLATALRERGTWPQQGQSSKDLQTRLLRWLSSVKDHTHNPSTEQDLARRLAILVARS